MSVRPLVRWSVRWSVRPLVRPSVHNAFVKIAENGVMQDGDASYVMYTALFLDASSVRLSVGPSIRHAFSINEKMELSLSRGSSHEIPLPRNEREKTSESSGAKNMCSLLESDLFIIRNMRSFVISSRHISINFTLCHGSDK